MKTLREQDATRWHVIYQWWKHSCPAATPCFTLTQSDGLTQWVAWTLAGWVAGCSLASSHAPKVAFKCDREHTCASTDASDVYSSSTCSEKLAWDLNEQMIQVENLYWCSLYNWTKLLWEWVSGKQTITNWSRYDSHWWHLDVLVFNWSGFYF